MKKQMPHEVAVEIRGLAVGGAGVGDVVEAPDPSLVGIRAFIPFTAPGDRVNARVLEHKGRFIKGELLSVLRGASDRVTPGCEYFGRCGGCELQHMSYEAQLRDKREMVVGALRSGRLGEEIWSKVEQVVPGEPYSYRRRVTLHLDRDGKVGFYERGSRRVVSIARCPISVPQINEVLDAISKMSCPKIPGALHLEAGAGEVAAVFKVPENIQRRQIEELSAFLRSIVPHGSISVRGRIESSFGSQTLTLPMLGEEMKVPAGSFSQVNWGVNQKLVGYVRGLVEDERSIHDLYAGAGNFGLAFARAGKKVLAVELDKSLVATGELQAKQFGLEDQISFRAMSVEQFLSSRGRDTVADIIVADPPRSGLGEVARALNYSSKLILITCDLPNGVRDIRELVEEGWRVHSIRPFDMFSQTSYLETVTYLTR